MNCQVHLTSNLSLFTVQISKISMCLCAIDKHRNDGDCRRWWHTQVIAYYFQLTMTAIKQYVFMDVGLKRLSSLKWKDWIQILLIKSNQITFIVTSPQHKCLGEWNSWEHAPDSAKKQNNLHIDSTYLQTVQKTMCIIHILNIHSVL